MATLTSAQQQHHAKVQALAGGRATVLTRRVQETLRFCEALKGFNLEVSVAGRDVRESVKFHAAGSVPRKKAAPGADSSGAKLPNSHQGDSACAPLRPAANQGEGRLISWTQDGTLLPVSDLDAVWGISRQAIDAARKERNELFSLFIKGQSVDSASG